MECDNVVVQEWVGVFNCQTVMNDHLIGPRPYYYKVCTSW